MLIAAGHDAVKGSNVFNAFMSSMGAPRARPAAGAGPAAGVLGAGPARGAGSIGPLPRKIAAGCQLNR